MKKTILMFVMFAMAFIAEGTVPAWADCPLPVPIPKFSASAQPTMDSPLPVPIPKASAAQVRMGDSPLPVPIPKITVR